jgi:UDP-N-acetylmuramate dehydrogenase
LADERGERALAVKGRLEGRLKGWLKESLPMSGLSSFGMGGRADVVVMPKGREDLALVAWALVEEGADFLVVGRGSNLLVSDEGFRGVVVLLSRGMRRMRVKDKCEVEVESGCNLNALLRYCTECGMSGLEELAGIPGSVGGAVRMNAGALGASIGERVREIRLLRLGERDVDEVSLGRREAAFAYREARGLGARDIVYEVALELEEGEKEKVRRRCAEAMSWRRERQPLGQPSAGSVFLNPEGGAAGEIIERCGLKGARVGDAMVSPVHANFIVNVGRASAADVRALIEKVREEVLRREGVELREEIVMVGFAEGEGG